MLSPITLSSIGEMEGFRIIDEINGETDNATDKIGVRLETGFFKSLILDIGWRTDYTILFRRTRLIR